jgi:hypothetical protein
MTDADEVTARVEREQEEARRTDVLRRIAKQNGTTVEFEREQALRKRLGAKDVDDSIDAIAARRRAAMNTDAALESAAPAAASESTVVPVSNPAPASFIIAVIWAVAAVIIAIVLLATAQDESYGGDAYTGIQNAVMLAVRGMAFLLLGSAALGLIVATRRDR